MLPLRRAFFVGSLLLHGAVAQVDSAPLQDVNVDALGNIQASVSDASAEAGGEGEPPVVAVATTLAPAPVIDDTAIKECQARVEELTLENAVAAKQLTAATDLAKAAQKSMEQEAKENIRAQSELTAYKRSHIDAMAAEVHAREAAELELATQKETSLAIAKELEAHKLAVDGLKDELSKAIERSLELKRAEGIAATALMEKVVAFDLLNEKYVALQGVYNDALEHLAHPMLSEYLSARGKELGEMRPELRAALEKAKAVMALPPNVLEKIDRGKNAILQGHEHLRSGVAPYVGDVHANSVSLGLVVFMMAPPLYLVYRFLQSVQRALQAHHFVLVLNFVAASYFAVVGVSSLLYHEDVLRNLQKHNPPSYALLQFATLGMFAAQLWWSGVVVFVASAASRIKYAQLAHLAASVGVVVHYYNHVWALAMLDQEHQVHDSLFFVYAVVYATGLVPAFLSGAKAANSVHASSRFVDSLKRS
ncbi:hypothetical protein DYB32_000621 [Aphanomyces invadans]|uniref:Uncharacterized protein n=1 Tax=Aphanomyces invadans TaxID=157072 RepID=A0A418B9F3_9STRA|nr:hypothetical protein DYB32_000621 [Aphanomyces invadans]